MSDEFYTEFELKMDSIGLYSRLLQEEIFDTDDSPAGRMVNAEIKQFAFTRLQELMSDGKKRGKKSAPSADMLAALAVSRVPRKTDPKKKTQNRPSSVKKPLLTEKSKVDAPVQEVEGMLDEYVDVVTETGTGQITKRYRKVIDPESTNVYYLGYDLVRGNEIPDNVKYILTENDHFRAISQQTLPPDRKNVPPLTNAQFAAMSTMHAGATLDAIQRGAGHITSPGSGASPIDASMMVGAINLLKR